MLSLFLSLSPCPPYLKHHQRKEGTNERTHTQAAPHLASRFGAALTKEAAQPLTSSRLFVFLTSTGEGGREGQRRVWNFFVLFFWLEGGEMGGLGCCVCGWGGNFFLGGSGWVVCVCVGGEGRVRSFLLAAMSPPSTQGPPRQPSPPFSFFPQTQTNHQQHPPTPPSSFPRFHPNQPPPTTTHNPLFLRAARGGEAAAGGRGAPPPPGPTRRRGCVPFF